MAEKKSVIVSEVLAPVGGREQLFAAVRCGADAVYLGTKGFNARRNAENFDDFGLPEAVAYCHGRGVKVHVTVNTLVMDSEREELIKTLEMIAQSSTDAVIVQDLSVAKLVRECCPTLQMHASTQMTIHNAAGVRALEKLGFSRVVLARELSLTEIKKICDSTAMQVETFVHGALCMSVSGGCYLSSMIGGRSGNRGLCAQPCRLDFKAGGRDYALSLKDVSYIEHIKKLTDAGVCAFKIEGRMKRPEYVAAAVTACRAAIDGGEPDMETLRAVFSRSGFTDGYLTGKRDLRMFGIRRKEDVEASARVLGELAGLYRNELSRVSVDMSLTVMRGESAKLVISDGENVAQECGMVAFEAQNRPIDADFARRSLEKTGGTPFVLRALDVGIDEGLMLPGAELNRLRRAALEKLISERSKTAPIEFAKPSEQLISKTTQNANESSTRSIRVRAEKYEQIADADMDDVDMIILPAAEILANAECAVRFDERLVAELPALIFPEDEMNVAADLEKLRSLGVKNALVENLGAMMLAKECKMKVFGGHGLNVTNAEAYNEYVNMGVQDVTLSFEMNAADIAEMGKQGSDVGVIGYGNLPLMRFRCCPIQKESGCKGCGGVSTLKDRTGAEFPVICAGRKYSTMLNMLPLYVFDRRMGGAKFMTVYFTTESKEECEQTLVLCKNAGVPQFERTRGLYFRTVL